MTTMKTIGGLVALLLALLALLGARAIAQAPASTPVTTAPALTEVQRLQVTLALRDLELTETRLQALGLVREHQQRALQDLVRLLSVEGYTLDLSTLTYQPVPAAPPEAPGPE